MKRFTGGFLLLSVIIVPLLACESSQPKTEASPWVQSSNENLQKIPVLGFDYKASEVSRAQWNRWAKENRTTVEKVLKDLPQGYVLQITGHTDARGPEEPEGDKPGNLKISSDRAKMVYDALKASGITSPRLTYRGVGSAQPISTVPEKSAKQRRVSFEVVPAN